MDLRRLNHLVALADERNFGRAALRVHLSQPALSRSVQAAEAELGLQLFDRGGLEVACTAAGAFVIARARKLVYDSRCLERDVGLYRERLMGDVAFGVGPYQAATLLPGLLTELRTRFAGINSRIEVSNWKYLLEHLRAEELDFFMADRRDVPRDADLVVTSIGRQLGGLFVRSGHPLLAVKRLKPARILPYGMASVHLPAQVRTALRQALKLGPTDALPVAVDCDDIQLLKRVTLSTDTVLACSHIGVRDEVDAGLLHPLPLGNMPPVYAEMGIVALKGRTFSPMAEFAVSYLGQLAAKQGAAVSP